MTDAENRKARRAAAKKARSKKKGKKQAAEEKTATDAVLEVVKQAKVGEEPIEVTLLTEAKATLHPVSPSLIQDVQLAIPDPPVPVEYIASKEREEENPNSPAYLAALARAELERTQAVLNAQIMFGVRLEDGFEIPEDFAKEVKAVGIELDESDPDAVKFAYKKYGVSNAHLMLLGKLSGISEEDMDAFRDLFRG